MISKIFLFPEEGFILQLYYYQVEKIKRALWWHPEQILRFAQNFTGQGYLLLNTEVGTTYFLAEAISSALTYFTSLFGMERGGTTPV